MQRLNHVIRLKVTKSLAVGVALSLLLGLSLLWVQSSDIIRAAESAVNETLNLSIGTLPAGKSVVLTFDATVGNLPPDVTQLSNQGEVSGNNFAAVLTDDPAQPGANDPTLIAVDPPDAAFTFSKTVGIDGFVPLCTTQGTIKVPANTTVVYCYTIRNTGVVTFARHTLVDSHLGMPLDNVSHIVAPSDSFSHTITATLSVSTTNVATWTAATADSASVAAVDAVNQVVTTTEGSSAVVIISSPTDDQDGDAIPDNTDGADDPDDDNVPNFLDTDSDNDGLLDRDEIGSDPDNPTDSDGDGVPDYLDITPTALDPTDQPPAPDQAPSIFLPHLAH